eukprot:38364-Eustigmatos_ZCMA.PRE.1
MAVYEITAPDGAVFEVEAPDSATEAQVMAFAQQQMAGTQMGQYQEGRAEGSPIIRGLSNVIQGPTFGFGDELVGAVG